MNYTKIFKRETKVIAYVVICLTLVVMGVSYALFLQVNDNKANQVVTAGSLEITYAKGNVVTVPEVETLEGNCLMPQDDTDGMESGGCEYELSIYNSGTLPMQYDLLIYDDSAIPTGGEHVPHEYIRHSLSKQYEEGTTPEVVTEESKRALSTLELKDGTKRIMERNVIQAGETIVFKLKIWIDENAPSDGDENIVGKYVYLKLDVSGLVYENEAATKTLLSSQDSGLTELSGVSTFSENDSSKEYRYVGANPKNYVYFNCSDSTKTDTCEIWRILGIYNVGSGNDMESRIKLIKANNEEVSAWDINGEKDYEASQVNSRLTVTYYDALSDTAKGQIDKAPYRLGGTNTFQISGFLMYASEYESLKTISVPVGLMNVSDYALASGVEEDVTLDNIASRNANNWLYTGKSEWFVNQDESNEVYALDTAGAIGTGVVTEEKLIRPVVYLDSNIKIIGGDGTSSNPYLLSK